MLVTWTDAAMAQLASAGAVARGARVSGVSLSEDPVRAQLAALACAL